jgi:aerobic carbon-monoxide dehydrogenase large subunit
MSKSDGGTMSDSAGMAAAPGARSIGARVKRVEDRRILTGRGNYVDDVVLPGMLHAAFLRSRVPHGVIRGLDVSEARRLPGVVAVYTGEDMKRLTKRAQAGMASGMNQTPGTKSPWYYALSPDKVRYVGDPIAMVVAQSRYIAEDALELIVEDIEMLEAVVTYDDALDPAKPPLFDELGDNVNLTAEMAFGDVDAAFAKADRIIRATVQVHRHQPVPMECRGTIASWDPAAEHLTIYTSTQSPHMARMVLPAQVDVPMEKIRVIAGDVGGGFGLKNGVTREDVAVVAASKELGRPVKWIEDRVEHLAAGGQAREEMAELEAAVTSDGVVIGVRMDIKVNLGAYLSDPFPGSMQAYTIIMFFQGPTRIEAVAGRSTCVFTNKATYVSYRGPWATGDFLRERLLDIVARELGLDPLDVRRRNYVVRGEPPLAMLTGQPFTGITTREAVDQAAELIGWEEFRRRQQSARDEGRYLGVGMGAYLEAAPGPRVPGQEGPDVLGHETTRLRIEPDGKLVIFTRQQPHGQGHETTLAQVAAQEFGVALEDITVRYGDTDVTPVALVGTGGSRAATMANGAVLHASRELRAKVLSLAAELLEASPADLVLERGVISVKGTPAVTLTLAELARRVAEEPERLPPGTDHDLTVTRSFDGGNSGWSGGAHCCIVEVDIDTGLVGFERYVVVEDCGEPVNPAIVEGQVRGGVTQGIGAVLLENAAYDQDGQLLASTFMDYLLPSTTLVPNLEIHHVKTIPTDPDVNFRGVGEGGMIIAPAAITNAIEDALAPFHAPVREQHLPPSRIVEMVSP